LFNLTVNNHMEQKRTDESDSCRIIQGLLKLVRLKLNQEEQWDKNLDTEHNKALLQGEALLEWRTALGHIGTDGVVVHIVGELELLVLIEVQLLGHHFVS